jgi:hypothetical protein
MTRRLEGQNKPVKVIGGRHEGQTFILENPVTKMPGPDTLPELAMTGNWAAYNAMEIDGYKADDAPFYYGKIGGLGYIIAEKDLEL